MHHEKRHDFDRFRIKLRQVNRVFVGLLFLTRLVIVIVAINSRVIVLCDAEILKNLKQLREHDLIIQFWLHQNPENAFHFKQTQIVNAKALQAFDEAVSCHSQDFFTTVDWSLHKMLRKEATY